MRRSTLRCVRITHLEGAYSAHAEVYPVGAGLTAAATSLLRACGGLPAQISVRYHDGTPTPRMRRSTHFRDLARATTGAYSAHAEVYPNGLYRPWFSSGLLRACGGLPNGGYITTSCT